MLRRSFTFFVFLSLVVPAAVSAQSLGQLAQKEKKRREQNKEQGVKVRVVAEGEVSRTESQGADAPAAPVEESGSQPAESDDPAASPPVRSDRANKEAEAEWRARMSQARSRLESAQKRHEALSRLYLNEGEYYVDENGQVIVGSLDELRRLVSDAKAELDAASKALEDLREEARRAGVPEGWLR